MNPNDIENDNTKCEGCGKPSTRRDSEGVPLCVACWDELPPAPTQSAVNQAAGETPIESWMLHVAQEWYPADTDARVRPLLAKVIARHSPQLAKLSAERDSKELEVKGALAQLSQHVSWLKVSEAECKALQQKVEEMTKEQANSHAVVVETSKTVMDYFKENCGLRQQLATATRQNEEMKRELDSARSRFNELIDLAYTPTADPKARIYARTYRSLCEEMQSQRAFWMNRYEGMAHEKLVSECIMRAVCREAQMADGEQLSAQLSAALAMVETMRGALETLHRLASQDGWNTPLFTSEYRAAVQAARKALSESSPAANNTEAQK